VIKKRNPFTSGKLLQGMSGKKLGIKTIIHNFPDTIIILNCGRWEM
jgi:hypothetical protein